MCSGSKACVGTFAPGRGYGTSEQAVDGEKTNAKVLEDELLMRLKMAGRQLASERTNDQRLRPAW